MDLSIIIKMLYDAPFYFSSYFRYKNNFKEPLKEQVVTKYWPESIW